MATKFVEQLRSTALAKYFDTVRDIAAGNEPPQGLAVAELLVAAGKTVDQLDADIVTARTNAESIDEAVRLENRAVGMDAMLVAAEAEAIEDLKPWQSVVDRVRAKLEKTFADAAKSNFRGQDVYDTIYHQRDVLLRQAESDLNTAKYRCYRRMDDLHKEQSSLFSQAAAARARIEPLPGDAPLPAPLTSSWVYPNKRTAPPLPQSEQQRQAEALGLPPLERVQDLERLGVGHKQIAAMLGLVDANGEPDEFLAFYEATFPGRLTSTEAGWIDPRTAERRAEIEGKQRAAAEAKKNRSLDDYFDSDDFDLDHYLSDDFECASRPADDWQDAPESIDDLLLQGVGIDQIKRMKRCSDADIAEAKQRLADDKTESAKRVDDRIAAELATE